MKISSRKFFRADWKCHFFSNFLSSLRRSPLQYIHAMWPADTKQKIMTHFTFSSVKIVWDVVRVFCCLQRVLLIIRNMLDTNSMCQCPLRRFLRSSKNILLVSKKTTFSQRIFKEILGSLETLWKSFIKMLSFWIFTKHF